MTFGANKKTLQSVATKPEYVRMYESVANFERDVADITYDTCKISTGVEASVQRVDEHELFDSSGNVKDKLGNEIKKKLPMLGMKTGEPRYFQMKLNADSVVNLKIKPTQMGLLVYLSYHNMFPSEVDHDFKSVIHPGDDSPIFVRPESWLSYS